MVSDSRETGRVMGPGEVGQDLRAEQNLAGSSGRCLGRVYRKQKVTLRRENRNSVGKPKRQSCMGVKVDHSNWLGWSEIEDYSSGLGKTE